MHVFHLTAAFTISLMFHESISGARTQSKGFFKDMCHCRPSRSEKSGYPKMECPGTCPKNLMGPKCQYVDANNAWGNEASVSAGDGDTQKTCSLSGFGGLVRYFFNHSLLFTYAELDVRGDLCKYTTMAVYLDGRTVEYKIAHIGSSKYILAPIRVQRFHDIRFDHLPFYTCAIRINGGTNVVAGQINHFTSTEQRATRSESALDTTDTTSCVRAPSSSDSKPYIYLELGSVRINKVIIVYNKLNNSKCQSNGFSLEVMNPNCFIVYTYLDRTTRDVEEYHVPIPVSSKVGSVRIYFSNSTYSSVCASSVLSLFEVKVFAHKECPVGRFGPECEMKCPSDCFQNKCDPVYGYCENVVPNAICTGSCSRLRPMPNWTSESKISEPAQKIRCSKFCHGNCTFFGCSSLCKAGYTGRFCEWTCERGNWGLNCSLRCPPKCRHSCHHVTGACRAKLEPYWVFAVLYFLLLFIILGICCNARGSTPEWHLAPENSELYILEPMTSFRTSHDVSTLQGETYTLHRMSACLGGTIPTDDTASTASPWPKRKPKR